MTGSMTQQEIDESIAKIKKLLKEIEGNDEWLTKSDSEYMEKGNEIDDRLSAITDRDFVRTHEEMDRMDRELDDIFVTIGRADKLFDEANAIKAEVRKEKRKDKLFGLFRRKE